MKEAMPLFNYTKAEVAEKAKELNFIRDTLEKVMRLTQILIIWAVIHL